MKICFISPCAGTRGAPRSLLETITVLQERNVTCCAIVPTEGPLIDELNRLGVQTRVIPFKLWTASANQPLWKRILRPILNLPNALRIMLQIRRWKCDLAYTNTSAVGIGAIGAKLAMVPHVWHIREFGREDHGQPFDWGDRITGWLINRLSSLVIVNSEAVGLKYSKYVSEGKLKRAHQAVRLAMVSEKEEVAPAKRFRCVIVGNVQESKGQEDAVHAIDLLSRQGVDCELQIVGDQTDRYGQKLQQLIKMNNIHDRIEFVGYVGNAEPYLRAADAVLVCSRCEAFGRVTIEGMLAGKPVIGARSGGTTELIIDGQTGLTYAPGNVEELAAKIRRLKEKPADCAKFGLNAQKWAAKQFNLERYGQEIWEMILPVVPKIAFMTQALERNKPSPQEHEKAATL